MATIYDVAKVAGVSAKTVSRVLNGDGPVGRETREAVEAAMRDLGYVPSNAARMMRASKSGLVGLITGAISTAGEIARPAGLPEDRKSTRLNASHSQISYAVFCF